MVAAHFGADSSHFVSDSIEAQALADDNGILNGHELKIGEAAEFFGMWHFVREKPIQCKPSVQMIATQAGGSNGVLNYLPDVYASLLPGGVVIWSGHSAKHHQKIRHQLGEFFDECNSIDYDGWPCLVAKKAK